MFVCLRRPFLRFTFVVVILLRFAYTFAWLKTLVGEAFLFLAVPCLFVRWCHVCVVLVVSAVVAGVAAVLLLPYCCVCCFVIFSSLLC